MILGPVAIQMELIIFPHKQLPPYISNASLFFTIQNCHDDQEEIVSDICAFYKNKRHGTNNMHPTDTIKTLLSLLNQPANWDS